MSHSNRISRLTVVLTVFLVVVSTFSSVAQGAGEDEPRLISPSEALRRDAASYAADYGVSLDEAIRRLQLQDAVGELDARLAAEEQATFAGLWIQHRPDYRIVVRFTRDGAETIRPYVAGGPLAGLVEVRSAPLSLADLQAAQGRAIDQIRTLDIPAESSINLSENRVELYVTEPARLHAALGKARLQLPDGVQVIQVDELSREMRSLFGGLAMSHCTAGYVVQGILSGTRGIVTAGHCVDNETFDGVALDFVDERLETHYDVQWHTTTQRPLVPMFFDGTTSHIVKQWKSRDNQSVGEYVCHHGMTSGYSCGTIRSKNIRLSRVPNSAATFIEVQGSQLECEPGDSGGPWFSGNTAYGIMEAKTDDSCYYMAIEYITGVEVELLTASDWCEAYDTNGEPGIQKSEAVDALKDYFDDYITKSASVEVLVCYFSD